MYITNDVWWPLLLGVMAVGLIAQFAVQGAFKKYSKSAASAGIAANIMAEQLLKRENSFVSVTMVQGSLTDHFNPKTNVVGLSQSVYHDNSVAALAVAAHEIGHVMQYEEGYAPIKIRNSILPVASFSSRIAPLMIIFGIILEFFNLALFGLALYVAVLLFQLITLPVEFNASNRALAMLTEGGYITYDEAPGAKKVLRAAGFTYVVAALTTLLYVLRYASMISGGRRRR